MLFYEKPHDSSCRSADDIGIDDHWVFLRRREKSVPFGKRENYFEKGEYKSAELEFRNAIQIDPEFVDAYERLGETYLKLGDPRGPSGNTAWSPSLIRKTSMHPSSWPRFT
jgi:tetratricopeptide (TPR) repeat protein